MSEDLVKTVMSSKLSAYQKYVMIKDAGVEIRYYHLQDENGKLFTTICDVVSNDFAEHAVSFAICNPNDAFSKKLGENISYGRAIKAMSKKSHYGLIRIETIRSKLLITLQSNLSIFPVSTK
jgi:hypothetical protein